MKKPKSEAYALGVRASKENNLSLIHEDLKSVHIEDYELFLLDWVKGMRSFRENKMIDLINKYFEIPRPGEEILMTNMQCERFLFEKGEVKSPFNRNEFASAMTELGFSRKRKNSGRFYVLKMAVTQQNVVVTKSDNDKVYMSPTPRKPLVSKC